MNRIKAAGHEWARAAENSSAEIPAMGDKILNTKRLSIAIESFAAMIALCAHPAMAKAPPALYPHMAPIDQYLMTNKDAEVALARSAAPESISRDAGVLVLGPHGYEKAAEGKNGFVCIVGRGWAAAADPDFWNPKVRVPMCVNAAAADSYLLYVFKITELGLAGNTPDQVNEAIVAAIAKKELPPMSPGAMCYMMSKRGFGGDSAPHWPSHLMFFYSDTDPAVWGANLKGSPVSAVADPAVHLTQFVIQTGQWSDGTRDVSTAPHVHPK